MNVNLLLWLLQYALWFKFCFHSTLLHHGYLNQSNAFIFGNKMDAIKNYFTNLINSYLKEFVEDFSPDQWTVGWTGKLKYFITFINVKYPLWFYSGELELKNLRIKKNALDSLKLPIQMNYGIIGSLKIQLNWFSLFSTPVYILISNLLFVTVIDPSQDEETKKKLGPGFEEKSLKKA